VTALPASSPGLIRFAAYSPVRPGRNGLSVPASCAATLATFKRNKIALCRQFPNLFVTCPPILAPPKQCCLAIPPSTAWTATWSAASFSSAS
jgi:hypothetical protein